jgi:hypothetical protein
MKQNDIEPARTTILEVKREMQKPRMTESVRNYGIDKDSQVAEEPPVHSE